MEIGFKSMSGVDYKSAYSHSFGTIGDKTMYYNPYDKDRRAELGKVMELGMKALSPTTGGAGTAGFALIPVYVDSKIVDISRKYTPFVEMIPRVTNQGMTADYNRITAKGSAFFAGLDAPLGDVDDTYERKSEGIKFLYSVGRVLGQAQAAMPSYMATGFLSTGAGNVSTDPFSDSSMSNAKQMEVQIKARALKELEENAIWNGDKANNPLEFDGIIQFQDGVNEVDADGGALTWDMIEEAVLEAYKAGGRPNIAGCSPSVLKQIRSLLVNQGRFLPSDIRADNFPAGMAPKLHIMTMVGEIPVFPSQYISDVSGSRSMYFIDTDWVEMRVLQDMTYEELAKTNDSSKFMLKMYECLVVRAPEFNAYIKDIL